MKCPNCKKEVKIIFTNLESGYPIDDDRSKVCEFCADSNSKGKSLQELNIERAKVALPKESENN